MEPAGRVGTSPGEHTMIMRLVLGLLIGGGLGAAMGYFGQCASGSCPLTSTWWRGAIYGGSMGLLLALSIPGKLP